MMRVVDKIEDATKVNSTWEIYKEADAIINTDYLEELKGVFPGIEQGPSQIQRNSQSIYSSIADIIDLENPSTNDVLAELREAKQVLTDTNEKMAAFNALNPPTNFLALLAVQNQEISTLSSVQGVSYTDKKVLRYYISTEFMLSVAENIKNQESHVYRIQF